MQCEAPGAGGDDVVEVQSHCRFNLDHTSIALLMPECWSNAGMSLVQAAPLVHAPTHICPGTCCNQHDSLIFRHRRTWTDLTCTCLHSHWPACDNAHACRHLSWASGNAFHVSAIAAAAIDSACMPWRQAGPAIGANDLHSVVQLLVSLHSKQCLEVAVPLIANRLQLKTVI